MYEVDVVEKLSKLPVFSLSDVNQIISNRVYAKKFLRTMVRRGRIFKIMRNKYTLHKDPFLASSFLIKPSCITGASALSYHKMITQMPNTVFCATPKRSMIVDFFGKIHFSHTKWFFGFSEEDYEGFKIMVADPEKAVIDSFSKIPVSVFEEAFDSINSENMVKHLRKIKKSSIVKRVGYLMEKSGFDVYEKLKDIINYKYVKLDPLAKTSRKKDRKWGIIVNI